MGAFIPTLQPTWDKTMSNVIKGLVATSKWYEGGLAVRGGGVLQILPQTVLNGRRLNLGIYAVVACIFGILACAAWMSYGFFRKTLHPRVARASDKGVGSGFKV